ncbi:MAG: LptF/LptG family permease [Spirochaetes bacterium]|nr:LptF/LptG family permease [Spirochaetota bacterium]MBX3720309.1 LptF/LptG family permease [Turneriella sp.]
MKLRAPRIFTLDVYLLRHFLPSLAVACAFFTFIVLVFFLKETIKHAVEKNLDFWVILELCWYALGWTLTLTIPMAFLLSTILTVGSLNADSEIIAMRAGGITYPRILRPFLAVAVVCCAFLIWFSNYVVPAFADNMENMRNFILTTDPIAAIQPGQFITLDKRESIVRKIYIEKSVKNKLMPGETLENIQVRKIGHVGKIRQLSEIIIAKEGRKILKQTTQGEWVKALRLTKGYLFSTSNDGTFQRIDFSNGMFDLNIQEPEKIKKMKKIDDMGSLTLPQLMASFEIIKSYPDAENLARKAQLEIHKRFALALSVIVFVLMGFPLAIVNRRSGKGMGLGVSVLFIFAYFALFLSAGTFSIDKKLVPPWFAAHAANILLGSAAAIFSLRRLAEFSFRRALGISKPPA